MSEKFIVYIEELEALKELTDEEFGIFMRAMIEFVETGKIPPLPEKLIFAFRLVAAHIERDQQKYAKISEKRKSAGKKGWEATRKRKKTEEDFEDDTVDPEENFEDDIVDTKAVYNGDMVDPQEVYNGDIVDPEAVYNDDIVGTEEDLLNDETFEALCDESDIAVTECVLLNGNEDLKTASPYYDTAIEAPSKGDKSTLEIMLPYNTMNKEDYSRYEKISTHAEKGF